MEAGLAPRLAYQPPHRHPPRPPAKKWENWQKCQSMEPMRKGRIKDIFRNQLLSQKCQILWCNKCSISKLLSLIKNCWNFCKGVKPLWVTQCIIIVEIGRKIWLMDNVMGKVQDMMGKHVFLQEITIASCNHGFKYLIFTTFWAGPVGDSPSSLQSEQQNQLFTHIYILEARGSVSNLIRRIPTTNFEQKVGMWKQIGQRKAADTQGRHKKQSKTELINFIHLSFK